MPQKLPFWRTVTAAYRLTLGHPLALLRACLPWLILLGMGTAAFDWFWDWPAKQAKGSPGIGASLWVHALFDTLCGGAMAVAWHRYVLMHEPAATSLASVPWRQTARYLVWSVSMGFVFFALPILAVAAVAERYTIEVSGPKASSTQPARKAEAGATDQDDGAKTDYSDAQTPREATPTEPKAQIGNEQQGEVAEAQTFLAKIINAIFSLLMFAAVMLPILLPLAALFFIMGFVPARLSVMLPARAVGNERVNASDVWVVTRGSALRLIGGILLTSIAPVVVAMLLLVPTFCGKDCLDLPRWKSALIEAATSGASTLIAMICVTFLSLAYRHWFGNSADGAENPAP